MVNTGSSFFSWQCDELCDFATLTHNLLASGPHEVDAPQKLHPLAEDRLYFSQLINTFFQLASRRSSERLVRNDIWTLVSLYVEHGENLKHVFGAATDEQREVLLFYRFAPKGRDRLTLRNFGKIFPFAVCEYYQLHGSKRRSGATPDEVGPCCPRFVCHDSFVYLIPTDPVYDGWFELYCKYRLLTSEALTRKAYAGLHPQQQLAICVRDRGMSYLDEQQRIFHLVRLCELAGLKSVLPAPAVSSSPLYCSTISRFSFSNCNSNSFDDLSRDILREKPCRASTPLSRSLLSSSSSSSSLCSCIPSLTLDGAGDDFAHNFIEWTMKTVAEQPLKKVTFSATLAKSKAVLLVYDGIDLDQLARCFYRKAMLRPDSQRVAEDLSLMISYYMQHGPFLTRTDPKLNEVARHYGLKNVPGRMCGADEKPVLTLSRVAKIFPWLVCQYAEMYGPEYGLPRPYGFPRYLAHQCFASLIPTDPAYYGLFDMHVQCRAELDLVLRPGPIDIEERLAKQVRFAKQARYTNYLTDEQRLHFVEQLRTLHSRNPL